MDDRIRQDDILDAVVKRARGYEARETVEEYAMVDGSLELVKRRVTFKDVPPDMTAAKMIMDDTDFSGMTDEQLERERQRLIGELKGREGQNNSAKKEEDTNGSN